MFNLWGLTQLQQAGGVLGGSPGFAGINGTDGSCGSGSALPLYVPSLPLSEPFPGDLITTT